jgi:predicted ribosome quality control (RQC) complex YloA/Tae2 family protein
MEANFFRFAVRELRTRVQGMRLQKIFAPGPDLWTLDLGRAGYLILKSSRKGGLFFLGENKPENPDSPPARVMQLRKLACSRRIEAVYSAWPVRKAALGLAGPGPKYLLLGFSEGPTLSECLGEEFAGHVDWPGFDSAIAVSDIWKDYPQLSPPLRHELRARPREQAERLYALLSSGYPEALCAAGKGDLTGTYAWIPAGCDQVREFSFALEAAQHVGIRSVPMRRESADQEQTREKRERKRIKRNLRKLEEEKARLAGMLEQGEAASLIQSNLFRLDKEEKKESVRVFDSRGREADIKLDPGLTVLENMQRMFGRGSKGKRGLEFVRKRKAELEKRLQSPDVVSDESIETSGPQKAPSGRNLPRKYRNLAVHVFETDDGFLLVRGKNSRANHDILSRAASPFDLWFHVQDGPGAHLILKRDHPEQEVPERSMQQAACLAALASYRKNDDQAEVICCEVRDVRKVKGAPRGEVVVDKVRETVVTEISPDLEKRLKMA